MKVRAHSNELHTLILRYTSVCMQHAYIIAPAPREKARAYAYMYVYVRHARRKLTPYKIAIVIIFIKKGTCLCIIQNKNIKFTKQNAMKIDSNTVLFITSDDAPFRLPTLPRSIRGVNEIFEDLVVFSTDFGIVEVFSGSVVDAVTVVGGASVSVESVHNRHKI